MAAMSRGGLKESRFTSEGWSVLYHTQVMIYSHANIGHWIGQTLGCSNLNLVLWFTTSKILTTVPRKVNPRKEHKNARLEK